MSSLRNSVRNISNPDNFYHPASGDAATATNQAVINVPTGKNFWTVSVNGPNTDYEVSVIGVGQTEARQVENGLIDGTSAGRVVYFRGNVQTIAITQLSSSGQEFSYSIVGSNKS